MEKFAVVELSPLFEDLFAKERFEIVRERPVITEDFTLKYENAVEYASDFDVKLYNILRS